MKITANILLLALASSASACLGALPPPGDAASDSDAVAADGAAPADGAADAAESNKDMRLVGQWKQTIEMPQYTSAIHYYFAADGALEIGFQRPVMQGATCSGEIRRSGLAWETSGSNIVTRGYRSAACAGEIRCTSGAGQVMVLGCDTAPNWSAQSDPSMAQYGLSADGNSLTLGEAQLERVR